MTSYLGTLGMLVPVGRAAKPTSSNARETNLTTTVGGGQTSRQSPRAYRTWGFETPERAYPNEVANLQSFVDGEWGAGPFLWVDDWSQRTNLLLPRDAALETTWTNTVYGGPQVLSEGIVAGQSLVAADGSLTSYARTSSLEYVKVPVLPGGNVCISAWANTMGALLGLAFYSATGTFLSTASASLTSSGWQRLSQLAIVPADAAYAIPYMQGGGRLAKPCVTWSDQLLPYHAGQGCREAIVSGLDQSVAAVWGTPNGQHVQASTTITEVGLGVGA